MNILCRIGLHSKVFSDRLLPSRTAPIVTAIEWRVGCRRCNKTISFSRFEWNGDDFIEVSAAGQLPAPSTAKEIQQP